MNDIFYKEHEDDEENDGEQGTQFGRQASLACIGIDVGRKRFDGARTLGEQGDREVIDRQGDGKDEARNHARLQFGDNHLSKCLHRRGTQVESSFK